MHCSRYAISSPACKFFKRGPQACPYMYAIGGFLWFAYWISSAAVRPFVVSFPWLVVLAGMAGCRRVTLLGMTRRPVAPAGAPSSRERVGRLPRGPFPARLGVGWRMRSSSPQSAWWWRIMLTRRIMLTPHACRKLAEKFYLDLDD